MRLQRPKAIRWRSNWAQSNSKAQLEAGEAIVQLEADEADKSKAQLEAGEAIVQLEADEADKSY